jgi:hypothetical protein
MPGSSDAICAAPTAAWASSRFPAHRPDWVFAADGTQDSSWATQFRLQPAEASAGERIVHLINRLSGGCVNQPANGAVRGHCNSSPRNRAAPPSATTELRWTEVTAPPAAASASGCKAPTRLRFEFIGRAGSMLAASARDGTLATVSQSTCDGGDRVCDFELLPLPSLSSTDGAGGDEGGVRSGTAEWYAVRSVVTGRLLRLHHSEMPEVPSWLGIHSPRARRKRSASSSFAARPRTAREMAASGRMHCPVRSGGGPSGWRYNSSLWAPLIDTYLAPWREGNITATILDMAFWRTMYGAARAHAIPGAHVSSKGGRLHMRENVDYRMELLVDMLRTVNRLVALPDVEFVTHLWDHPKVDRQTPLPIFSHYGDASHRDVPVPAPWSWDEKGHNFPQPWVKLSAAQCSKPWDRRSPQLYFRGGCNGPTRGWRGPLWRYYPRKRTNRISHTMRGQVNAGTFDHCDSPKLSKLEWGWDEQMEREMSASGRKQKVEKFASNCEYKHLLHVDGNVASSRLASELHVGSVIFKQESFSSEYFYPLLRPYVHYVPVQTNLRDVPDQLEWAKREPQKAKQIAARGQAFAREHLHPHSIACYWWQLLSAFAELQDFEPRTDASLGFRAF